MLAVALAGLLEQARVVGVQLLAHDGVGVLQDLELLEGLTAPMMRIARPGPGNG